MAKRLDVMKAMGAATNRPMEIKGRKFSMTIGTQEVMFFVTAEGVAGKLNGHLANISAYGCGRLICQFHNDKERDIIEQAKNRMGEFYSTIGIDRFLVVINSAEVINNV